MPELLTTYCQKEVRSNKKTNNKQDAFINEEYKNNDSNDTNELVLGDNDKDNIKEFLTVSTLATAMSILPFRAELYIQYIYPN